MPLSGILRDRYSFLSEKCMEGSHPLPCLSEVGGGFRQPTWISKDKSSCMLPNPQADLKHCLQDGHSGMTSVKYVIAEVPKGTSFEIVGAFSPPSLNHSAQVKGLGSTCGFTVISIASTTTNCMCSWKQSWHWLLCVILSSGHVGVASHRGMPMGIFLGGVTPKGRL